MADRKGVLAVQWRSDVGVAPAAGLRRDREAFRV